MIWLKFIYFLFWPWDSRSAIVADGKRSETGAAATSHLPWHTFRRVKAASDSDKRYAPDYRFL
jgi:hypothetical protein